MSGSKLRVAVLFGGRSAEHEISLLSARFVVEMHDRERFEPILIGIDKSGRWLLQEEALLLGAARDPRLAKLNQSAPDVALAAYPGPSGDASLTIGAGDLSLRIAGFTLGGIGTATFGAILLYQLWRDTPDGE